MSKETGGPAFPSGMSDPETGNVVLPTNAGMTMRDYFAAKALQGMLANSECYMTLDEVLLRAYQIADSMLKVRDQ